MSHCAFSSSNNKLLDSTKTNRPDEIGLPVNDNQFYNISQVSDMKFHHLSNEGGPSLNIATGIIGSHSAFNGRNNSFSKQEGIPSLPRPPIINGSITAQKYDSSNGATSSRDGVELQQKKVAHLTYIYIYI